MTFETKIFGERNTGTNVLKKIVETNSKSRVFPSVSGEVDPKIHKKIGFVRSIARPLNRVFPLLQTSLRESMIDRAFTGTDPCHRWKHTATRFDSTECFEGVVVIFCTRNPYSWLSSLFKNSYHLIGQKPQTFAEFIDMDWKLVGRDNLPYKTLKPHQLYQEKIISYYELIEKFKVQETAYHIVKFEDIVIEQAKVFGQIKDDLYSPQKKFDPITQSTKSKSKDIAFYKDYYGNEKWRVGIEEDIQKVEKSLDKSLFEGLYTL